MKNAVSFIGQYEETLSQEAGKADVDGVICGHIHHATMRDVADIRYINTGDWVESCTAVAEHEDGQFELIKWTRLSAVGQAESKLAKTGGEVVSFDPVSGAATVKGRRSRAA